MNKPSVSQVRSIPAFSTTATVAVTEPGVIEDATALLFSEVEEMDIAASRFRSDSEVILLFAANGEPTKVSPLLFEAVEIAIAVARWTDGAVDPTVGRCLNSLGYDRDFAAMGAAEEDTDSADARATPAPGWLSVELDAKDRTVRTAPGTLLDLGATAKALTADRAARRIANLTGSGTLVSIGGDVSVAGTTPQGGWAIGIAQSSRATAEQVDQVVAIASGGLATSSTTTRSWRHSGRNVHHIVDPATGESARPYWDLVSVAASNCVLANAASTAAIVWGTSAPKRLKMAGFPARLVSTSGAVKTVCDWPQDPPAPASGYASRRAS